MKTSAASAISYHVQSRPAALHFECLFFSFSYLQHLIYLNERSYHVSFLVVVAGHRENKHLVSSSFPVTEGLYIHHQI